MEEVFDKIKEHANKAKDSAVQVTKTVIEKTNNIVNQTKLKFSISETKSKIKDIYTEIGKSVYENYKSTGEVIDDMEEKFAKIDAMTEDVYKRQVYNNVRNLRNRTYAYKCRCIFQLVRTSGDTVFNSARRLSLIHI